MRHLALAMMLLALPAYGQTTRPMGPVTYIYPADINFETFTGTGYAGTGTWSTRSGGTCAGGANVGLACYVETEGTDCPSSVCTAAGTVDPDETSLCPSATGFAGDCLQTDVSTAGFRAYATWDSGSAHSGDTWWTVYFSLSAGAGFANLSEQKILYIDSASGTPAATPPWSGTVGAGAFVAKIVGDTLSRCSVTTGTSCTIDGDCPVGEVCDLACGDSPYVRLVTYTAGTIGAVRPCLSPGVHRLNVHLTPTTSTGEVRLDGELIAYDTQSNPDVHCSVTTATSCVYDGDCPGGESCVASGHGLWRYMRLGNVETSKQVNQNFYWDGIAVSSTGYVD